MFANPTGQHFPPTRWTVVYAARGEGKPARAALEELCRAYWAPVYAFIRRRGHAPADAEDLTQGFFAQLLARESLEEVAEELGRLRTFLLKAVTRFLINQHEKASAAKRGHGFPAISIDAAAVEGHMAWEPGHHHTPEIEFARQWGLGLLDRAFAMVEAKEANLGRPGLFQDLKGIISLNSATASYAEIAARHGLSEGAVKVAAHRLRQSFRQALRALIAETVATEEDIDDEIQNLFQIFQS
jgi:RNA polymerase sigma-70 factor (ECF subfamily)